VGYTPSGLGGRGASIHFAINYKIVILNKYLDQSMPKIALFFDKIVKIAAALEDPPPTSLVPASEVPCLSRL